MRNLLAQTPDEIFGVISPPPGSQAFAGTAGEGLSRLLTVSIQFLIIVAALFVLFYMLIGAFMWVTSGGDEDQLQKARLQMTHAVWGFLMIFVALSVFGLVTGDILGIIKKTDDGGWNFSIPTLQGGTDAPGSRETGETCNPADPSICRSGRCVPKGTYGECL